jgi:hypothetical protein
LVDLLELVGELLEFVGCDERRRAFENFVER